MSCHQGARYVEYDSQFSDSDEKKEAKGLKITLNLNGAACKLKMQSFPEVVDLTTKVCSRKLWPVSTTRCTFWTKNITGKTADCFVFIQVCIFLNGRVVNCCRFWNQIV